MILPSGGRAAVPVIKATASDSAQLVLTLARAFMDDPIYDWLISGDKQRLHALFRAYLDRLALKHEQTWMTTDRLGAALWAPPGAWSLGLFEELLFLPDWLKVIGLRQLWSRWRGVEMIQKFHPSAPHWYLMAIGIAPEVQGQGRASLLLQPVLEHCDASATPAYLETATPGNLPLYRRFGFEVIKEIVVPGGPRLWLMWREPLAVFAQDGWSAAIPMLPGGQILR